MNVTRRKVLHFERLNEDWVHFQSPKENSLLVICFSVLRVLQAILEKGQAELAADRQAFSEKSQKLDAIMKQVQGLQDT